MIIKKSWKSFLYAIFFILFIFILITIIHKANLNNPNDSDISALVKTQQIQQKSIIQTIPVYGTVNQNNSTLETMSFPYGVQITQIFINAGDAVAKGKLLLLVATDPAVGLSYQQAKAELQSTHAEYKRLKRLLGLELATKSQVESAYIAHLNAKANFDIQQKQGNGLPKQAMLAPYNAVITDLFVKPGDRISAGTPVLQLADRHNLVANMGVEPTKISLLKPKMQVQLVSVLDKNQTIMGTIKSIGAMIDPKTRLVDIIVQLDKNSATTLLPGTPVQGNILADQHHCLAVPKSAILSDDQDAYIYQVIHNHAYRINITTGDNQNNWVCITGKFDSKQKVVISGNYELTDGMAVREK